MREQLEPVPPRIRRVEAADAWKRSVPLDALAGRFEPVRKFVELLGRQAKRRVRLTCGTERILDADVQLAASGEREPRAAARAQRLRFLELFEAEQVAEKAACFGFAAGRCRELDVV
jgi:hypothetical protein